MNELILPDSPEELAQRLQLLHEQRKKFAPAPARLRLSGKDRALVLGKTAARCHLCGGVIKEKKFAADHVLAHAAGGTHAVDNYLPAHSLCNGCRWFYSAEEFQWILKMGVWARKQMEDRTAIGMRMLPHFLNHEKKTRSRRKTTLSRNALEKSGKQKLNDLAKEFDAMYERMQTPQARVAMKALFNSTPAELGKAAVEGARKRR